MDSSANTRKSSSDNCDEEFKNGNSMTLEEVFEFVFKEVTTPDDCDEYRRGGNRKPVFDGANPRQVIQSSERMFLCIQEALSHLLCREVCGTTDIEARLGLSNEDCAWYAEARVSGNGNTFLFTRGASVSKLKNALCQCTGRRS